MYLAYRRRFKFLEAGDILYYNSTYPDKRDPEFHLLPCDEYTVVEVKLSLDKFDVILEREGGRTFSIYEKYKCIYENVSMTSETKKNLYQRIIDNKISLFMSIFKMNRNEINLDNNESNYNNHEYIAYYIRDVLLCSKTAKDIHGKPIEGNCLSVSKTRWTRPDGVTRKNLGGIDGDYMYQNHLEEYLRTLVTLENFYNWRLWENWYEWEMEFNHLLQSKNL